MRLQLFRRRYYDTVPVRSRAVDVPAIDHGRAIDAVMLVNRRHEDYASGYTESRGWVVTCKCGAEFTVGPESMHHQWRRHVATLQVDAMQRTMNERSEP